MRLVETIDRLTELLERYGNLEVFSTAEGVVGGVVYTEFESRVEPVAELHS